MGAALADRTRAYQAQGLGRQCSSSNDIDSPHSPSVTRGDIPLSLPRSPLLPSRAAMPPG